MTLLDQSLTVKYGFCLLRIAHIGIYYFVHWSRNDKYNFVSVFYVSILCFVFEQYIAMYKSYCNAHYYKEFCKKRLKMEIYVIVLGDFLILWGYTVQNFNIQSCFAGYSFLDAYKLQDYDWYNILRMYDVCVTDIWDWPYIVEFVSWAFSVCALLIPGGFPISPKTCFSSF